MRKHQQGFTLIELMIVVAIIGILAAIAVPSYMDYQKKAKASELLLALSPAKAAVSEYIVVNGVADVTTVSGGEAGVGDMATDIVSSIEWDQNGPYIVATGTSEVGAGASDVLTLYLQPSVGTDGQVTWECYSAANDAQKLAPASCRTTVPSNS